MRKKTSSKLKLRSAFAGSLMVACLLMATLGLAPAEASITKKITYSSSFTNDVIALPAGFSITVNVSESTSGTVSITNNGYNNSESFSGLGSDTREMTLGDPGTYTVNEDWTLEVTGTAPLMDPVTETFSESADPWTFDNPAEGSVATLSVSSTLEDVSVTDHSDNISVELSGLSATVTTTEEVAIGDSVSVSIEATWKVTTSIDVSPPPEFGTIVVNTNLAAASFTVTGPETRSGSGTSATFNDMPVGDYTVTFDNVTGYHTPPSETQTLTKDSTITFTGEYIQMIGTVEVNTNLDEATFTVTGPETRSGSGTSAVWTDMPVGDYTVYFDHVSGYDTPDSYTQTLNDGQTITFTGTYTVATDGTIEVYTNNDAATFDLTGPESRSGSGRSASWTDLPQGTYTVTFHDITGYDTPSSQTGFLAVGETLTFNGMYSLTAGTGTIQVTTNKANATFDISGPASRSGSGTSAIFTDMPTGKYTISFHEVFGHITPAPQSALLLIGETISFNGEYAVNPDSGTVEVFTNNPNATFQIVNGPITRSGSGLSASWIGMPTGDYTVTFYDVTDYSTPQSQTKLLTAGGTVTFNGVYEEIITTGTIQVNTNNPDAVFDLTGPNSRTGTGQSRTFLDMPTGEYEVTFQDIPGFAAPAPKTATLTGGSTITFTGEYTAIEPETGIIIVETNLQDEVTFTVTSPDYTQDDFTFEDTAEGRTWTLTDALTGEHTIAYGEVEGYTTPEPQTLILQKDRTITFIGEYLPIEPDTGTIVVETNLRDEVTFTVTSPDYTQDDFTFEDTEVGRTWTLTEVPVGPHGIIFGDVENYDTPEPDTQILVKDETITFVGNYVRHTGTIVVETKLRDEVTFTVTSPDYTQSDFTFEDTAEGRTWMLTDVPTGDHTIAYGDVDGYTTPEPQTLTLEKDSTITFIGEYDPILPVISSVTISGSPAAVGETIVVEMTGDTGNTATFSIEGVVSDVPMNESLPGIYTGQYVIQPGDSATDAVVSVKLTGATGGTATDESGSASIDTTPPMIASVDVSGSPARYAGDIIKVTMNGETGGEAVFSIAGAADNIPMTESATQPGTYEGEYTAVDGLGLDDVEVAIRLTDSFGNTSMDNSQSASICTLLWDVNRDGVVDVMDIKLIGSNLGKTPNPDLDLNNDGVIDMLDLLIVAMHYGETCGYDEAMLAAAPFAPYVVPNYLFQNYPNPCNPGTWIPFMLAEGQEVSINIYNPSGQLIRRLDLGYREPGIYVNRDQGAYWDGSNEFGEEVASGIYFYHIKAGRFSAVRKMLVAK